MSFDDGRFRLWLREEMDARRMSQRMLGRLSGVNHSVISRILATDRSPSINTMVRLAAVFGADIPAYLVPLGVEPGPLHARIRNTLMDMGVDPAVIQEMLAVYRRNVLTSTRPSRAG